MSLPIVYELFWECTDLDGHGRCPTWLQTAYPSAPREIRCACPCHALVSDAVMVEVRRMIADWQAGGSR